MNDKILLTGGIGFIGIHTAFQLIQKGYEVIIVDNLSNSNISALENLEKLINLKIDNSKKKINFFKGDIRDESFLKDIFESSIKESQPFSGVIHFAGLKAVGESNQVPIKYWENNVFGTINLLKIMDKYNCKNIIFSSSATIYGELNQSPIKENNIINPTNPYGNTKAIIEKFLSDIYRSSPEEWKIANLRYFNPVGAHPSGLIGENPNGMPNNIFPIIGKVAKKEINKLKIFGNDWDTPDGTGIRDYIHVSDVADGHIATYEYLKNDSSQILNINLGTGIGTSVLELVKSYEKSNNVQIPYEFVDRRIGDVSMVVADNSKAKLILNWYPKKNLLEMCQDAWLWENRKSKI